LVSRKLAATRMVLCASPGYLRKHGRPKHPAELSRHAVLAYSLLATGDQWAFEGPQGPVAVTVQPIMRSNSGDTCIAAARKHRGLVFQPSFMVSADLRSGSLVEVMPQYRAREFGIYAVYPTRQHVSPKVRALMDFLARKMDGVRWCGEAA